MKTALMVALIASVFPGCLTRSQSAENASASTATNADADLQTYQLRDLETHIQRLPPGQERDYFSGMLAARSGHFGDAIAQLNRALPHLRESAPKRAALALEAIATAHRADNDYGDAARAYADLADHFADQLDHFPADDATLARILRDTPRQTIAWHGPVKLKTFSSPIGTPVTELVVNGIRATWILDTGANQSVVSRTFAERLGLKPLSGVASVGSGVTGRQSSIRAAVLPMMQVGGATLTNVVLLVIDDENLRFGSGPDSYQVDATLGYPILKALGVVTFTRDELLAGEAAEPTSQGARMYMRGLTPAIESEVQGRPLLFTVDTGASSTDFSVRYFELFHQQATSWKKQTFESAGAGGSIRQDEYVQPRVVMKVGTTAIILNDVSILPVRRNAGIDVLFGNLGQDFVRAAESISLDFSTMTVSLGAARNAR